MNAHASEHHAFYIYAWLYPDGVPFYVGKGRGGRDAQPKSNAHFKAVVAKIRRAGDRPRVVRWQTGLTEGAAFELERKYILLFGRKDRGTGVLTNQTDGGEGVSGWVPSDEWRAMRSLAQTGKPLGDGARMKLRVANLGRVHTPAARSKMSASHTGKKISQDSLAKLIAANAGKKHSEEHRLRNAGAQYVKPPSGEYKGVSFHKQTGKWRAQITTGRRQKHLGLFASEVDAARAYDKAVVEVWGVGNCYLNFPTRVTEGAIA